MNTGSKFESKVLPRHILLSVHVNGGRGLTLIVLIYARFWE